MKKLLPLVLAACLLLAALPLGASAYDAVLSPQKLLVNGKPIECEKYNIDGSNYFKLRDLACLLSGTVGQFSVSYDAEANAVVITPGQPYVPLGGELLTGADNSATALPSPQAILFDGNSVGEYLSVYNIGGSNFFNLRELCALIGIAVDYDAGTDTALITSPPAKDQGGNGGTEMNGNLAWGLGYLY